MSRYQQLLNLIEKQKPKTILEIGTWNGRRAKLMAAAALKYNNEVHYIGYDLFESANQNTDEKELNIKRHYTLKDTENYLNHAVNAFNRAINKKFTFELYKGNTNETLKETNVDFVFIDGGHSVETIQNDYNKVKNSSFVVFDDYYIIDDNSVIDLDQFGANQIVDEIENAVVLSSNDIFFGTENGKRKEAGRVSIAFIDNKNK